MFKNYLFRNSDPSIDMILCMTWFLLSCHHQRNSDTPKAANTKPLCTLCPTPALEPWIRRFTIFTDLVQREGNGEVKIQESSSSKTIARSTSTWTRHGSSPHRAFYLLTWKNRKHVHATADVYADKPGPEQSYLQSRVCNEKAIAVLARRRSEILERCGKLFSFH